MTDYPITPPPELFKQWDNLPGSVALTAAYRAGADAELEACCEVLENDLCCFVTDDLRAARRPKPPSLAEEALKELTDWTDEKHGPGGETFLCEGLSVIKIRHALERLQELENNG